MYCLYLMLTNYTYKYHDLCRYDYNMYIKRYVGMLIIYICQVCIKSDENRYIYDVLY